MKTAVRRDKHSFKLTVSEPIKTDSEHFTNISLALALVAIRFFLYLPKLNRFLGLSSSVFPVFAEFYLHFAPMWIKFDNFSIYIQTREFSSFVLSF